MMPSLQNLHFRPPTLADAEQVLALMIACDMQEYGLPDSELDDLRHDWQEANLEEDACLAFSPEGELLGYALVMPWGKGIRYEFYIDPAKDTKALGKYLLARCEERGAIWRNKQETDDTFLAKTYVAHTNQRNSEIVEQANFECVNYIFNMQIKLDDTLTPPNWPDGVSVRTTVLKENARAIHDLIQTTFEYLEDDRIPFEKWEGFMINRPNFDPNLWFLAFAGKTLIGACLCFAYSDEGWVRQLGVLKDWRRKGVGGALLQHTFAEFKKRGFNRVGLSVNGENPNAYHFYQNIGMTRLRQYNEYKKVL